MQRIMSWDDFLNLARPHLLIVVNDSGLVAFEVFTIVNISFSRMEEGHGSLGWCNHQYSNHFISSTISRRKSQNIRRVHVIVSLISS